MVRIQRHLAILALLAGCGSPEAIGDPDSDGADTGSEIADAGLDAPAFDAPGLDAPALDAPGLDAPGLDAPGLDAPGLDAFSVDASSVDAGPPRCPTFGAPETLAHVMDARLAELSGLAAARESPSLVWTHHDSGMTLFAVNPVTGVLRARLVLTRGGTALGAGDTEDIAIGPGASGTDIYLGDIGDGHAGSTLRIARVTEPSIPTGVTIDMSVEAQVMEVRTTGIPDAETLLFDPIEGVLFLVTKESSARLCRIGAFVAGTTVTARCDTTVPTLGSPSSGDVSPDGRWLALRNEGRAFLWHRDGAGLESALAGLRCELESLEHVDECNGEAIAFTADGSALISGSEQASRSGVSCPMTHLHRYSITP